MYVLHSFIDIIGLFFKLFRAYHEFIKAVLEISISEGSVRRRPDEKAEWDV